MPKNKLTVALLLVFASAALVRADDKIILPAGFVYEDIYVGPGMTAIDFDPAGRLYVCQKMGRVILFEPKGKDYKDPVTILDLKGKVFFDNECGLLGIAIDPEFNTNHFFYVFYTTQTDQRLVRYLIDPATNEVTGETILLSGLPRTHNEHKSGDIHFRPTEPGNIYITAGNDTTPDSAVDDVDLYNGKVLRVNKANGQGLPDNPFTKQGDDLNAVHTRVWATGLRNPFRFTFPASGLPADAVYIAENGDQNDRFYQIKKGANGGWNHGRDQGLMHPPDPNVHVLGIHKPSMTGIAIAETGPFASPDGKPILYVEHWWLAEVGIIRGVLGGPNKDTFIPITTDANGIFADKLNCVNLKFGPDGALYTTNTYFAAAERNEFHLGRIKYTGPALPAIAAPVPPGGAPAPGDAATPAANSACRLLP